MKREKKNDKDGEKKLNSGNKFITEFVDSAHDVKPQARVRDCFIYISILKKLFSICLKVII